jgi:hypothetical protein
VASGGQLFISGTQMSDTSCPNCSGQYVTFDSGTAITVESGGTLNSLVNNTFGATVLISGAGILRADVMNVSGDITVTGSGSALGAESALTVGGTLRVLAAGSLRAFQNGCQVHVNAATIVSGPGSTITAGPNVSANGSGSLVIGAGGLFHGGVSGPILVQQEGALLVTNSCAGPVIIESGGVLNAAGYFYERVQALAGARIVPGVTMSFANGLTLDSETDIAGPGSLWALPQGLTINWDALSPRTTAFLSGASNCSLPYIEELGGPLTVNVRNANALRVGRTLPVLVHGTCAGADSGSFNLFVAPSLDGGRVLTMIQTGNIGTVSISVVAGGHSCWGTDFNGDGDLGTDADIEAFFACLAGNSCPSCGSADFNADGDLGTDADIESFFRVLGGGPC